MTRPRPIIYDKQSWIDTLMEHRRALFERVVAAFPELLQTKRSDVDMWRIRLGGRV